LLSQFPFTPLSNAMIPAPINPITNAKNSV